MKFLRHSGGLPGGGVFFDGAGGIDIVDPSTPRDALMEKEEAGRGVRDAMRAAQIRAVGGVLEWIFMDGFENPRRVAQRCYVLAHKLRHDLIGESSCAKIAELFGETRAMHSLRVKLTFDEWLASRGARAVAAPWQKPDSQKRKLAAAAKGNRSRKKGVLRKGK